MKTFNDYAKDKGFKDYSAQREHEEKSKEHHIGKAMAREGFEDKQIVRAVRKHTREHELPYWEKK